MQLYEIKTWPKSRFSEIEKARVIKRLALKTRCRWPVPVLYAGKVVALVGAHPFTDEPYALPAKYWLNIGGFDDLLQAITVNAQYFTTTVNFNTGGASPTANNWYDSWLLGGDPGVGDLGASNVATQRSDQTLGAIQHGGDVSPAQKLNLWIAGGNAGVSNGSTTVWEILLVDRVLAYDQCVGTGSSVGMTNGVTAARYFSDGIGLQIVGSTQAKSTSGSSTVSVISYTNQTGTASRTAAETLKFTSTLAISDTIPGPLLSGSNLTPFTRLQAGDIGARSIEASTGTTDTTAVYGLSLCRPICAFVSPFFDMIDLLHASTQMQPILDGACLSILFNNSGSANQGTFMGQLAFGWA